MNVFYLKTKQMSRELAFRWASVDWSLPEMMAAGPVGDQNLPPTQVASVVWNRLTLGSAIDREM